MKQLEKLILESVDKCEIRPSDMEHSRIRCDITFINKEGEQEVITIYEPTPEFIEEMWNKQIS